MDNILGLALTSLSIIGILVSGAVWVIVLVNRVSVRTIGVERDIIDLKESTKSVPDFRDLQRDVVDLKEATKKLEEKTSFESLERITKKVMLQVVHSKDFKDSIRDVILHIEKNRTAEEAGAFSEILHQLQELKNETKSKN